jgi:hypothetical protein
MKHVKYIKINVYRVNTNEYTQRCTQYPSHYEDIISSYEYDKLQKLEEAINRTMTRLKDFKSKIEKIK